MWCGTLSLAMAAVPLSQAQAAPLASPSMVLEGPEPAPAPVEKPRRKGLGMLITGAILTGGLGLPLTVGGTVIIVGSKSTGNDTIQAGGSFLGGFTLVLGIINLAVGVPLLGVGASRYSKWRKWKSAHAFTPAVGRTAFGTYTPGVALRF